MHAFITITIPFDEDDGRTLRVRDALAPFGNLHRDARAVGAPPISGFPDAFDAARAEALRTRLDATGHPSPECVAPERRRRIRLVPHGYYFIPETR